MSGGFLSSEIGATTLVAPRRKMVVVLVGSIVFVAVGVFLVRNGSVAAWAVIAVFAAFAAVALLRIIRPARLVISQGTIEFSSSGGTSTRDLARCGPFEVLQLPVGAQSLVVFDHPEPTNSRLSRASRQLSGRNSALPGTYGLPAAELAQLLNDARARLRPGLRPTELPQPDG